jgi:glycosyltransferase involved in cell wall biosynthesis
MRINMVSEHASPLALLGGVDAGGQNVHVADLSRALGRLGVDVVVHTRRDDPALPRRVRFAERVWVDHVDAGPATPLPKDDLLEHVPAFADDLDRVWRDERPDVVHSHFWMSGLAALEAAGALGIPVAHTYHALGVVKRRHQGAADTSAPVRIDVERRLAREADRIIATTCDEQAELVAMGGDPSTITVVPCGVDLARFRPGGPATGTPGGRVRVVVVSRLVERKGIGNVIEALPSLPEVDLVVDEDPEARRFAQLADRLGVGRQVELLGAVSRDAVPALVRSADIVACCPWYEPFGLVAVEAMACGVPVVASGVGGLAESVLDGVTGIHVRPRSPGDIAAAIRTLVEDEPRRRAMGAAGARRALRFGWDRVAADTLAVLRQLPTPRTATVSAPVGTGTGRAGTRRTTTGRRFT